MHTFFSSHILKRSWHSYPRRVNAGSKNTPSTHHPRRRNVTTLMVGLKKKTVTYAKISPKSGEPQRYSWGTQKQKKRVCVTVYQVVWWRWRVLLLCLQQKRKVQHQQKGATERPQENALKRWHSVLGGRGGGGGGVANLPWPPQASLCSCTALDPTSPMIPFGLFFFLSLHFGGGGGGGFPLKASMKSVTHWKQLEVCRSSAKWNIAKTRGNVQHLCMLSFRFLTVTILFHSCRASVVWKGWTQLLNRNGCVEISAWKRECEWYFQRSHGVISRYQSLQDILDMCLIVWKCVHT